MNAVLGSAGRLPCGAQLASRAWRASGRVLACRRCCCFRWCALQLTCAELLEPGNEPALFRDQTSSHPALDRPGARLASTQVPAPAGRGWAALSCGRSCTQAAFNPPSQANRKALCAFFSAARCPRPRRWPGGLSSRQRAAACAEAGTGLARPCLPRILPPRNCVGSTRTCAVPFLRRRCVPSRKSLSFNRPMRWPRRQKLKLSPHPLEVQSEPDCAH